MNFVIRLILQDDLYIGVLQNAHRGILFNSEKNLDKKIQRSSWKSKWASCEFVRSKYCNGDTACVVDDRRC